LLGDEKDLENNLGLPFRTFLYIQKKHGFQFYLFCISYFSIYDIPFVQGLVEKPVLPEDPF